MEIGKRRVKLLCHRRHRVYPVCVLLLNFLLPTLAAPKIRQTFLFKKPFNVLLFIPPKTCHSSKVGKHICRPKFVKSLPPCRIFIMEPPSSSFSAECSFLTGEGREEERGWARSFIPSPLLSRRRCAIKKMQPTSWWCQDWRGRRRGGFFLGCTQLILSPLLFYGYRIREEACCCVVLTLDMGKKGEKSDAGKIAFVGLNCPSLEKV